MSTLTTNQEIIDYILEGEPTNAIMSIEDGDLSAEEAAKNLLDRLVEDELIVAAQITETLILALADELAACCEEVDG